MPQWPDFFSLDALITAGSILLGSAIGIQGLRGLRMTERRRKFWRCTYSGGTLLLIAFAIWHGTEQSADSRSLEKQAKETHDLVFQLARNLNVAQSEDIHQTLRAISQRVLGRRVSPEQSDYIQSVLRKTGAKKFQLSLTSDDDETLAFARQLASAFIGAGWIPARETGPLWLCETSYSGVVVSGRLARHDPVTANAVATALARLGVVMNDDRRFNSCAPKSVVEIFIGKP